MHRSNVIAVLEPVQRQALAGLAIAAGLLVRGVLLAEAEQSQHLAQSLAVTGARIEDLRNGNAKTSSSQWSEAAP